MGLFLYSLIIYLSTSRANGATHWLVTEDGRIQSQTDSLFNLQRPYDLVAMLKQEDRAKILEDLKQELLIKKESIDKSDDRDTGLEQRFYRTDPDCIAAGKTLPEFDLYISTVLPLENKGIRPEEHIDFRAQPVPDPVAPSCTPVSNLDFSMEAFEHLEGVRERSNLTGTPELGLKNAITHRENVDDYGHLVYEALKKNKTSWVLYNMAAFYWRIKGHPYNVVECVRRALHFSPRSHKDVALISLANILHRARHSNEAAIVVQAALDVSKDLNVNHFTLGNIYAVLADYNKSVVCFENTLKIQPDFEAAGKRRHAVLCHAKLEAALEDQHRSLQRTLNDLKDYQEKHETWQSIQEKVQMDQASSDAKFAQRVGYESYKIRKMAADGGDYCKLESRDGRQVVRCSWAKKNILSGNNEDFKATWAYNREPPMRAPETSQRNPFPAQLVYMEPVHLVKYTNKYSITPEEDGQLEYKNPDWPSKEECDMFVTKFPTWNEFPTTYLPPENKGFEVKLLLSEAQDLKEGMQHSLPWYPPVCNLVTIPEGLTKSYDHIQTIQDRAKLIPKIVDPAMRTVLLSLVEGDITEAEIGQRILTALKKEIGPPWMLYNLAALYWRVIGNPQQGIDCLRQSLYFVPPEYKDVPLLNLANLLYKLGRVDDAVTVMKDAVKLNDLEPETHFFLGNMLAAKGNITGATYHYEQALLQDADHAPAFSSIRTLKCYYKYHRTAQSAAPTPKEPTTTPATQTASCSQSCTSTCRNKAGTVTTTMTTNKTPVESRLVCKKEAGRENCVLETSIPNCDQGQCSQSCHVSPLSTETCEGPNGLKCLGHNTNLQDLPADGSMPKCPSNVNDLGKNCRQPSSLEPLTDTIGPNPLADAGFYEKMEAVKEYYRTRGLCDGDDCQKYFMQNPAQQQQQRPHTKLEIQDGVLHQKLILVDNADDIVVGPGDCIIYNDGRRTAGCQRDEYRTFDFEEFSTLMSPENDLCSHGNGQDNQKCNVDSHTDDTNLQHNKHGVPTAGDPTTAGDRRSGQDDITITDSNQDTITDSNQDTDEGYYHSNDEDYDLILHEEDEETELEGFDWDEEDITIATISPWVGILAKTPQKPRSKLTEEDIVKNKPDPMRHITAVTDLAWPTWDECRGDFTAASFKDTALSQFSSTWVSVSTKNINVDELIDFHASIRGLQEPFCVAGATGPTALDAIPSLNDVASLRYSPERGLVELLQTLGGDMEAVGVVGTKIAKAIAKKPSSWALCNLAALYWRVEGDQTQALTCLRVAHQLAPDHAKDIALLGIVNILYNSGRLEDALLVCDMALHADNNLVATHFTMANIYAAKEDYARARSFYESTLGLQSSFHPARERLHFLRCHKILSNPHLFKNKNPNTLKMEL